MKKFLVICALSLSLAGCASLKIDTHPTPPPPAPAPIVVVAPTPPVVAPKPDPVTMAPVQWRAYNASDLKKLSDSTLANGGNVLLFTLDETNYKNLQDNLNSIDKYIRQQNAIVDFLNKAANAPSKAATDSTVDKK